MNLELEFRIRNLMNFKVEWLHGLSTGRAEYSRTEPGREILEPEQIKAKTCIQVLEMIAVGAKEVDVRR
jgi:hypothetical protein